MGTRVHQVGRYRIVWHDLAALMEQHIAKVAIAEALFGWLS